MNTVEQVVARYTEDALESFGIEQAEFKKHAKVCEETGIPAVVMLDYSREDNAYYYSVIVDDLRVYQFDDVRLANDVTKSINNYINS